MTSPIPMTLPSPHGGRYTPSKLMWWHDHIIDLMLANPSWTKKQIAHELNATAVFVYMITNSDLFQARYARRREEYERMLGVGLSAKITEVADRTLDRILAQIKDEGKVIPLNHLESLADKTLSRLGYGPKPSQPAGPVQIQADRAQVVVVPAARCDLEEARRLIREREDELAATMIPRTVGNESRTGSNLGNESTSLSGSEKILDLEAIKDPTVDDL